MKNIKIVINSKILSVFKGHPMVNCNCSTQRIMKIYQVIFFIKVTIILDGVYLERTQYFRVDHNLNISMHFVLPLNRKGSGAISMHKENQDCDQLQNIAPFEGTPHSK